MHRKIAMFSAWFIYVAGSAVFCWMHPGEHPEINFAGQVLAASVSVVLIVQHAPAMPPMRSIAPWAIAGLSLCFAAILFAPAGSLADEPAMVATLSSLVVASLLLPLTCGCLSCIALLIQRFQERVVSKTRRKD